ncbi:crosslink repair DNA glycosylase YcaQ family protein [Dactylosporangium sp. NPDC000555]|uniref:DNA glycosylase AlkZ-like family protein n=1 Tax=Dactylosporangium sp. NPDC000555 TaxID=3154260 RepID=UPI00332C32A0
MTVDREQWIGFRWQRHGLDGQSSDRSLDDLFALGVQGGRQAGAELSLMQRASKIGGALAVEAIGPDGPLVNLWSVRGAPHAHRITHVDFIRDALAPDASDEGGTRYVAAVDEVAGALRSVVKGRMSKADASRAVADQVSKSLVSWCERCKATHVPDGTFRAAGLQAQVVLGPEERRATTLCPKPRHRQHKVSDARLELVRTYLRVNGPSTKTLLREWLGGAEATVATWSRLDDLVKVQVANKRYELPEELLDAVRKAPKASGVVLVPANDPYLRQVDRSLLVPDSRQRQQIWKALSGPGALLVDGEVAGFWRYRGSEHKLNITTFTDLKPAQRSKAEKNAALVAEANRDDQPKVVWD